MPPRYQEPELAKLASDLNACNLNFTEFKVVDANSIEGADSTPLERAYGKITLNRGHAESLAQYQQLKDLGDAIREHLSAAIIAQGMLAPKEHPAFLEPSVDQDGQLYEMIRGLIQISGQQFFTITSQQAVKHDIYIGTPGICRKYFLIDNELTIVPFQNPRVSPAAVIQQKPVMGSPVLAAGPSPNADDGGLPASMQLKRGGIQYTPAPSPASHPASRTMQMSTQALQVRVGDLRVLLEAIDREQDARDRVESWLTAVESHPRDSRHPHTHKDGLDRPDSILIQHEPAAGALLANSQQSGQRTIQTPALSRVSLTPADPHSYGVEASGSARPQEVSRSYPSTEQSARQGGPGPNKRLRVSNTQSSQYPAGQGNARHT